MNFIIKSLTLLTLLFSTGAYAKTFKAKNAKTGQTISVSCLFPNSTQCQYKIEEAKKRVLSQNAPQNQTLFQARANDTGESLNNSAQKAAKNLEDNLEDGAQKVQKGLSSAKDQAQKGFDKLSGQTYRVKVPGHEHTMTFHCFGGLESNECQTDKDTVVSAIKKGSDAQTLAQFRLSPLNEVKEEVVENAEKAKDKIGSSLDHYKHNTCRNKLERHAKDFDEDYARSGRQLTNEQQKLSYIKDKLIEENSLERCQVHYDNALLGYQLEWISQGKLAQKKTHIFDRSSRLPENRFDGESSKKQEIHRSYASGR